MYVAVIDDKEASLAAYSQLLKHIAEIEPICFARPSEALYWLAGAEPAFVVVDYTLSEFDGVEFVRKLRATPGRKQTPVLMTCARNDKDVRRVAFELDIYAFLEKPINPNEFLAHATHILSALVMRLELERRLAEANDRAQHARLEMVTGPEREKAMIDAMISVATMHDASLQQHLRLASTIAKTIGKELSLTQEELQTLSVAAQIYDIGKVAIPQSILYARNHLGPADRITIETHAEAGARILSGYDTPQLRAAAQIAAAHHERYDGSGYPRKLRGTTIPLFARIVAVADTLSSLLRNRGGRQALTLAQAIDTVEGQSGLAYDPSVVETLRKILPELSHIVHEMQPSGRGSD